MAERFNGRTRWCGGLLVAFLGGCAAGTPSPAPTPPERPRVLPHGLVGHLAADRANPPAARGPITADLPIVSKR